MINFTLRVSNSPCDITVGIMQTWAVQSYYRKFLGRIKIQYGVIGKNNTKRILFFNTKSLSYLEILKYNKGRRKFLMNNNKI